MIFPGWTPVTDGFGYTAEANSVTYTGRWIVPCTAANLQLALTLIDSKDRFLARKNGGPTASYPYKAKIQQTLLSALTAQKMSFKILDSYAPNTLNANGTSVDLNSGINTLENADLAISSDVSPGYLALIDSDGRTSVGASIKFQSCGFDSKLWVIV